jgi:hypothetical protein
MYLVCWMKCKPGEMNNRSLLQGPFNTHLQDEKVYTTQASKLFTTEAAEDEDTKAKEG